MSVLCRDDIDESVFTDMPAFMRAIDARALSFLPTPGSAVSQTSAGVVPVSPGTGRRSASPAEVFFFFPESRR